MTAIDPPGRLVQEFEIPATFGKAFVVRKGQVLRIHQVDTRGGQVGDCAFFNANDTKEVFHCGQSWALNQFAGTGNSRSFKHFWSKPPRENIMLTTLVDTYRDHWGSMGGRCSKRIYEMRSGLTTTVRVRKTLPKRSLRLALRATTSLISSMSLCRRA